MCCTDIILACIDAYPAFIKPCLMWNDVDHRHYILNWFAALAGAAEQALPCAQTLVRSAQLRSGGTTEDDQEIPSVKQKLPLKINSLLLNVKSKMAEFSLLYKMEHLQGKRSSCTEI